jgi:hypothetical protein
VEKATEDKRKELASMYFEKTNKDDLYYNLYLNGSLIR